LARAATVAILRAPRESPAAGEALFRLQGELSAVGLAVALVERPRALDTGLPEGRAWLEAIATERGIDAFIDVVGEETPVAVDVWLCDRSRRRLRRARIVLDPGEDDGAATVAIRTIEVLRSSLLALDWAAERDIPRPHRKNAPASPPREPLARIGIEAGVTALASFDGLGTSILPLARVELAVSSWLALELSGAGFGTRPRVETAAGEATVAQAFALLGLCLCSAASSGVRPFFALSFGTLALSLDAHAEAPNVAHHVEHWSALVNGSLGARVGLSARFYLTFAAQLQLAEPYAAIHFVDDVVATTGHPNLLLTLTIGVRP
jgi:hypothetical protein